MNERKKVSSATVDSWLAADGWRPHTDASTSAHYDHQGTTEKELVLVLVVADR